MLPDEPIGVIVNPAAGHGAGKRRLSELASAGRELGLELRVEETEYPGHATALAKRAVQHRMGIVVVMGGDGTVGEVVNGLVHTESSLGVIAVGTGNDLARSLGLPLNDPRQALETICSGRRIEIDVGRVGKRYFVSVLGIGFPALVAAEANKIRNLHGPFVFFLAMYKSLLRMRVVELEVRLDQNKVVKDFTSVLVQNTPYTGGGLLIAPEARLDDGLLDVITVDRIGKIDLMMNLHKLYKGRHLEHPCFSLSQCKMMEIQSKCKLPAMFDGDLFGYTPLRVETREKALKVIVKQ